MIGSLNREDNDLATRKTQTTFFWVYQFTTLKGNHTRIGSENRAMFVSSRESLLTFGQKRTLSCEAGEPMGL